MPPSLPTERLFLLWALGAAFVVTGLMLPTMLSSFPHPVYGQEESLPEREPGHINVRRRVLQSERLNDMDYWEGFIHYRKGRPTKAVENLRPIAQLGQGYELAQHTLGLSLMATSGLNVDAMHTHPKRATLYENPNFQEGIVWISRAANANLFQAQDTLIRLYAAGLGPDDNPLSAATWIEIYNENPIHRLLGIIPGPQEEIKQIQAALPLDTRIAGIVRAREWLPRHWTP
ncbi:MAG: hypothetical protein V6Z81_02240 [Parvularculales bacterium]